MAGVEAQHTISELSEYLNNAALNPTLWDGFAQLLSQHLDDSKVIFQVLESEPFNCMHLQTYGFMPDTIKNYIDYYIHLSPWKNAILQASEAVPIWTDQYISMKQYYKSEFYNDLMRSEGNADSASGMNIIKRKDRLAIVAVHFDNKKSEIMHRKASYFLSSLHKDLKEAMNLNKLLNVESIAASQSGDFSLANFKLPAFIVDSSTQVFSLNQALVELMEKYDFFQIGTLNKLYFTETELQNSFHIKLRDMSTSALSGICNEHTDMRIIIDDLIFKFSFFPLNNHYNITDFNGTPTHKASVATFMVVINTQKIKNIDNDLTDLLNQKYRLTKTEIKIINYIADGNTLNIISELNNTSIHTVRTHLKSIFQKTNTQRQQELALLIHMLRQSMEI